MLQCWAGLRLLKSLKSPFLLAPTPPFYGDRGFKARWERFLQACDAIIRHCCHVAAPLLPQGHWDQWPLGLLFLHFCCCPDSDGKCSWLNGGASDSHKQREWERCGGKGSRGPEIVRFICVLEVGLVQEGGEAFPHSALVKWSLFFKKIFF